MQPHISTEFPFESKYLDVHGSRMHYIEKGSGNTVLFLHGNPTSCYLWRNIIPHLSSKARCIAPDLIGMGRSDKPDLAYRFQDHYRYLSGFIDALKLKNITLVMHDWGSGLGFHYAHQNAENIKGMAFMEAIMSPLKWSEFPPGYKLAFKLMRSSGIGWFMISAMNMFVQRILPQSIVRPLSKEEMDVYKAPYPSISSRKPVRQWPREIPIDGRPAEVHEIVESYNRWLQETPIPKILFYAHPGGLINEDTVAWAKNHMPNLIAVDIGDGIHYLQEDNPHKIGEELAAWYTGLK